MEPAGPDAGAVPPGTPVVPPPGRTARRASVGLFSRLIGLRAAVALLLVVGAATALGALRLFDYDVFDSWWYAALLGLVGLQTALCTVSRARPALMQALRPGGFRPDEGELRVVDADLPAVIEGARRQGYRLTGPRRPAPLAAGFEAVLAKGRLQPLGFLVLHAGLLILLVGLVMNLQQSSVAEIALAPGERVLEREGGRQIEVVAVRPGARAVERGDERGWELTSLEADLRVFAGADLVTQGTARLGDPLALEGAELVLLPTLSRYLVTLRVTGPDGRVLTARITSDTPQLDLPGAGGLAVRVEGFAPDAVETAGGWRADSPLLRAPLAAVSLVERAGGAPIASADLRPGGTLTDSGYTVAFVRADHVIDVLVSRQGGELVVLAGAVSVLVGMLMSLLFSFRLVRVRPVEGGVEVRAFARRRHQPLAEELDRIAGVGPGPGIA